MTDETILRVFWNMVDTGNVTTTERRMGYRPGWIKMAQIRHDNIRFAVEAGRWVYRRKRLFKILEEARHEQEERDREDVA